MSWDWDWDWSIESRLLRQVEPLKLKAQMEWIAAVAFFLLGTGFDARHVSIPLLQQGWHVSGTCTTSLKKNQLSKVGIDAHLFDANRHKLTELETLRDASHVLVSIPPAMELVTLSLSFFPFSFSYFTA